MSRRAAALAAAMAAIAMFAPSAVAAGPPDSAALLAAQREALAPLAIFDGTWRGPARIFQPDGRSLALTQTERVGSLLGGTLKLIEGRGFGPDGSMPFNAFAVISYSPQSGSYSFRSHAQGHAGDFPLQVRADGFSWTIEAAPQVRIRYTATVKDEVWTEVGERLVDGRPPVKTFEMELRRVGATDWPAAGAPGPQ